MVLQSDISHWQLVYNRNTTSKGKSDALTKKTSWELSKTTMDTAATSSAACEAGEDEAVLVIRPSHSRHTRPIWECYNYYTTATNILQCLAWVAWHSAMKPRKSAILGRSNIARHGWILITFALFDWLLPLSNLGPDHLCLLWILAACYFHLVIE